MSQLPSLVIVGGGTAGVHAARMLRGLHDLVTVTLVEPTGQHQFLTRLAAVAGGVTNEQHATMPLHELVDMDVVAEPAVRVEEGAVTLGSGRVLAADRVLLTAGAHPSQPPIAGIRNALTLRSAADALAIRHAAATGTSVVVVGGGPTGCQLAGALASGPFDVFVTLIEASGTLLNGFNPVLGARALDILTSRGVSVWTGRTVERIEEDGVVTTTGTASGIPVWAGGFQATAGELLDAPTINGRVCVDDRGLVAGTASVFAAGDIAAHPMGSSIHPMSAQVAAKAGRGIAINALQDLRGGRLHDLPLSDLGWVVDLSGWQGVAEILGLPLASPLLDRIVPFIHDAIDLRNLVQIGGLGRAFARATPAPAMATSSA